MLRAGLEPATCRLGVDNRNHPARSREVRRGHEMRSGRGVEPQRRTVCNRSLQITEPLRPATILLLEQACQGSNPDQRGWSSPCSRLHHRPRQSGRPGSNGSPRSGAPVLFPLSYVREWYARLDSNQRPLPSQDSALSAELRAYEGASGRS